MLLPRAASNLADRITIDLQEDRMTRAKRTIGLMTAVLVLAVGALSAQAQPQFGGTWTLDPSQSQLPAHQGRPAQTTPDDAARRPDDEDGLSQGLASNRSPRDVPRPARGSWSPAAL